MHFTSTVIRPPYEARSTYLQVTSGCSHNKCKYCFYYKNVSFNISSNKEIEEDIIELKDIQTILCTPFTIVVIVN